jgi:hypothetical protein
MNSSPTHIVSTDDASPPQALVTGLLTIYRALFTRSSRVLRSGWVSEPGTRPLMQSSAWKTVGDGMYSSGSALPPGCSAGKRPAAA